MPSLSLEPTSIDRFDEFNLEGQYSTDDYQYPVDLFADGRYGGNYVVFFINISEDSKLYREMTNNGTTGGAFMNMVDRIRSPYIESQQRRGATTESTTAAAVVTSGVGGVVLNTLGLGGGASAGTALLSSAGQVAIGAASSNATRSQKRLKTAIALHVPNQLQIRYGMQWSEEDTFALDAMQSIGTDAWNALKSLSDSDTSSTDAIANAGGNASDIVASKALQSGPLAGALSSATGLAANPKKEQVFKGVNFRDFTFEYQFFPRNPAEAQTVQNIIHQFKYHMHPEFKDPNNFLFVYPSEFDISYYQNGEENPHLHKHASCVLTDLNINYTPNGVFSTFDNGMPTQINVTLSFRELALITKEKIGMTPGEGL